MLDRWGRIQAQVGGAQARYLPSPVQIHRPGEKPKRAASLDELDRFFMGTGPGAVRKLH